MGAIAVALLTNAGAACREAPPAQQANRLTIRVATGQPGASFRPLSTAILMGFATELPDTTFVAVDTPGSGSNLEHLQSGHADIALAYSDGVYRAYAEELRNAARSDAARAIAVLHPAPVHVLVRGDADVRSIADLRGRRIASGALGTGTAYTSEVLLRFFGVSNQTALVHRLSFEQSVEALRREEVDAAFVVSSDPVETVRAATDRGAVLLPISGDTLDQLLTDYPFFRRSIIPSLTYPRQPRAVPTVAVDTLLMCRRQLDDTVVRNLAGAFFRILPDLVARFPALRAVDQGRAPAAPVPLHPGAALFYRESELAR